MLTCEVSHDAIARIAETAHQRQWHAVTGPTVFVDGASLLYNRSGAPRTCHDDDSVGVPYVAFNYTSCKWRYIMVCEQNKTVYHVVTDVFYDCDNELGECEPWLMCSLMSVSLWLSPTRVRPVGSYRPLTRVYCIQSPSYIVHLGSTYWNKYAHVPHSEKVDCSLSEN